MIKLKDLVKTSKIVITINNALDEDLIVVLQQVIELRKCGYLLTENHFCGLIGKTLEFTKEEPFGNEGDEGVDVLKRNTETLELSLRAYNCLKFNGIETIGQLVKLSEAELLKKKSFGRRSMNEIKEVLQKMGLSLAYVSSGE